MAAEAVIAALAPVVEAAFAAGTPGELRRLLDVLRLEVRPIDRGTVRVNKTVAVTTGGRRTVAPGGKTSHARRTLAVAPETVAALKAHRARQNARRLSLGEYWRDGDLVFDRHDGGLIDATLLRRALAQDVAAAGVPPLTPHGMRHTMATVAIAAGAPLHAVAKRLGHRNVNLTANLYGHMSPDADRQAMEAMAKVLQG